jgi:hypothetical protein
MVVLDHGYLSFLDCGQRAGATFLGAFLLQAAMVVGSAYSLGWSGPKYDRYKIEMLETPPLFSRRRLVVGGIWCAVFLIVSSTCACLRVRTVLFVDDDFVTETSCIGPYSEDYRLDRQKVDVTFVNRGKDWFQSKRSHDEIYLQIAQPGKPRPIYIDLWNRGDVRPLVDLAPRAMQDYDDYRRTHQSS